MFPKTYSLSFQNLKQKSKSCFNRNTHRNSVLYVIELNNMSLWGLRFESQRVLEDVPGNAIGGCSEDISIV